VESQDAEDALVAYAEGHPDTIVIGRREGFCDIFLEGSWPERATMLSPDGHQSLLISYRRIEQAADTRQNNS